jgi:hypothetical protein
MQATDHPRSHLLPLIRAQRASPRGVLSFDREEDMSNEAAAAVGTAIRDIPIDWEALEDAFENNAPEVHSYLHLVTGDVLRVVDGVADPQMHARIAADANYLRIDPVSSREQYRWMERYIPMVEDPDLQAKLSQAIDGKGRLPALQGCADVLRPRARALVRVPERAAAHLHGGLAERARVEPGAAPDVGSRGGACARSGGAPVHAPRRRCRGSSADRGAA